MTTRIVVTVAADGTISAATKDVTGPRCMDQMDVITTLCAPAAVVDSRLTEDYQASTTSVTTAEQLRDEATS